jgi:hypothetical protein
MNFPQRYRSVAQNTPVYLSHCKVTYPKSYSGRGLLRYKAIQRPSKILWDFTTHKFTNKIDPTLITSSFAHLHSVTCHEGPVANISTRRRDSSQDISRSEYGGKSGIGTGLSSINLVLTSGYHSTSVTYMFIRLSSSGQGSFWEPCSKHTHTHTTHTHKHHTTTHTPHT